MLHAVKYHETLRSDILSGAVGISWLDFLFTASAEIHVCLVEPVHTLANFQDDL